jgi:predicted DNA-binding transcriptional regulator YafY
MPKDKQPHERYQRIHEIFSRRRGKVASIKLEALAEELGISVRTLQKDKDYMEERGAPFHYDAATKAWQYQEGKNFEMFDEVMLSDDEVLSVRLAMELFNKINHKSVNLNDFPEIFRKIYKASRKWTKAEAPQKHIYFDPLPAYEGGKHLKFFLKAIEDSRSVAFYYQGFHAAEAKIVQFDPYFIRYYDRRIYVGGWSHAPENFIRTFPLERIQGDPEIIGFYHNKPPQYNAETYWKYIYGITIPPEEPNVQEVLLAFSKTQRPYFLSTPFFEPYEIVENTPDQLIVRLRLRPNIDLVQKLGSLGAEVRVLSPASLVERMKDFHLKALEGYGVG